MLLTASSDSPSAATTVAMTSTEHSLTPAKSGLPPLALIAGPTASGKSGFAVALARSLIAAGRPAAIINADASQVYADVPILSAQPSATERAGIPHHLFGSIDGVDPCDAARWATLARAAIAAIIADGAIPIIVGGTGLYLRTLLDGIAPVPAIDPVIRAAVRALPVADGHAQLAALDPAAAARLAPADTTRVARALEVIRATGRPLSAWQAERHGGIASAFRLTPLILLPPRDVIHARCEARLDAMLALGALDEVTALLARALPPALPVMRTIGVPQFAAHLSGDVSLADALTATKIATRQYAKRQYTWFRNQPPADWPRHGATETYAIDSDLVIKCRQRLLTE